MFPRPELGWRIVGSLFRGASPAAKIPMGVIGSKITACTNKRPSQTSKRSSEAADGAGMPNEQQGVTPAAPTEPMRPPAVAAAGAPAGEELTFQLPVDEPLGLRLSETSLVLDLKPEMAGAQAGVRVDDVIKSVDWILCDYEYAALDLLKKKAEPDAPASLRHVIVWRAAPATAATPLPAGVEEL